MIRSMIDMYKEWGWMPKWELYSRETWTMEGDPAIPFIADTWLKGLRDFDINTAYEAFYKSATLPGKQNKMRPDVDNYYTRGYVPMGEYAADMSGDNSVSHALEYYIADASLANLAEALGKNYVLELDPLMQEFASSIQDNNIFWCSLSMSCFILHIFYNYVL